jgi:hypothetical protein
VNILELISKQHAQVRVEQWDAASATWTALADARGLITKVSSGRLEWRGWRPRTVMDHVRGIRLSPGMRIVVRDAARHWPGFRRGEGIFYAQSGRASKSLLHVAWQEAGQALATAAFEPGAALETVRVPATVSASANLVAEVPAHSSGPVFFGVHRLLDRQDLYRWCKGKGAEIGPGSKPQILPAPDVDVTYIEQATPDQWQALYGIDTKTPVDTSLWDRYVVGNADRIPAEPASLDFIFSSHVVEHLANPLGHMAYWATLLRKGGVVAAVIPDMKGCKDFVFTPSSVDELAGEFREGDMTVKLHHYQRWGAHRAPGKDAREILESGRSIHVHFYTPDSMRSALKGHFRQLGFSSFEITSSANHKDFFVLLKK